jgi:putative ABC transport system permease protein
MNGLLHDLRYALRQLGQSPAFTVTAILTLALGIGANTAMFTLVNVLLLRQLPLREPERLVSLSAYDPAHPLENSAAWPGGFTFPMFLQMATRWRLQEFQCRALLPEFATAA